MDWGENRNGAPSLLMFARLALLTSFSLRCNPRYGACLQAISCVCFYIHLQSHHAHSIFSTVHQAWIKLLGVWNRWWTCVDIREYSTAVYDFGLLVCRITILGTGAKWLSALEDRKVQPSKLCHSIYNMSYWYLEKMIEILTFLESS